MKLIETKKFIVNWLKNYSNTHNLQSLIVGVSGGVDSSLTSTLCAATELKTIIISMPIHQQTPERENTQKHIKWLLSSYPNVKAETIDLTKVFAEYKNTIPLKFQSNLSLANTQSRIRMNTLYQIATKLNGIVVGTGNKIEDFGIGFFTKYGDGGVDISPIGDLTKSEVKQLAQYCNIHTDIINAEPTDGLWRDGRTDKDQIGATYEELEWAMEHKKNEVLTKRKEKVLKIYQQLHKKNKHKMEAIPVCEIPKEFKN